VRELGELSRSKAVEIAGTSRAKFIDEFSRRQKYMAKGHSA
jgi:hypothetical protein